VASRLSIATWLSDLHSQTHQYLVVVVVGLIAIPYKCCITAFNITHSPINHCHEYDLSTIAKLIAGLRFDTVVG
jgi:ethanolamine transporter EutH